MTDPIIPEEPTPQPLPYATREERIRERSTFTDSVAGVMTKHALWRANGGRQQDDQAPEDIALGLAIVRDPQRYLPAMLRLIVYSSKRAGLEDETSLSEGDIEGDVQESWPLLIQMFAPAVS